ncbi:hypothetical protein MRX96_040064 [Rhipicephalus microplus]
MTMTACGKERKGWGALSEGSKMKRRRRVFDEPAALLDSFVRSASRKNKNAEENEHAKTTTYGRVGCEGEKRLKKRVCWT